MSGGATRVPGVVEHEMSTGTMLPARPKAIAPIMIRLGFICDCNHTISHHASPGNRRPPSFCFALIGPNRRAGHSRRLEHLGNDGIRQVPAGGKYHLKMAGGVDDEGSKVVVDEAALRLKLHV